MREEGETAKKNQGGRKIGKIQGEKKFNCPIPCNGFSLISHYDGSWGRGSKYRVVFSYRDVKLRSRSGLHGRRARWTRCRKV